VIHSMMQIVSINMILELNELLRDKGLMFQVHLRDACGRQSMWAEALDSHAFENSGRLFYQELEAYFSRHKMGISYAPDRITFWIAPDNK